MPAAKKPPITEQLTVLCVTMQRDEEHLLPAWLAYHGHLFGHENLIVLDNGSVKPTVRHALAAAARLGVEVRSMPKREDFENKHKRFAEVIAQRAGRYDFAMPLDTDEFVVRRVPRGLTCDRTAIRAALMREYGSTAPLRIAHQFANHPTIPDLYMWFEFHKSFFAAGTFKEICHGFHNGSTVSGEPLRMTDLCHLHFHHWPYQVMRERARRKWSASVPPDEAIRQGAAFEGTCKHLLPLFSQDEASWLRGFDSRPVWLFPEFRRLLASLGAPIDVPIGGSSVPACGPADAGEYAVTPMLVPSLFDADAYRERNPDVALNGADPLRHFVLHGHREGRRADVLP